MRKIPDVVQQIRHFVPRIARFNRPPEKFLNPERHDNIRDRNLDYSFSILYVQLHDVHRFVLSS
jgi:hypothetical protein